MKFLVCNKYELNIDDNLIGDYKRIKGYQYKDSVPDTAPFPCNPYYDAKAGKWLECHFRELVEPIVFWSIGS